MPAARTSGLETTVFNVLTFVLGCGMQDVEVPFDRRMNLDMLFEANTGFRLGVEYDGAYWHLGRESRDRQKAERLVGSGFVHDVMRIREEPLDPLGPLDVSVPRGAPGDEVAGRTVLHLQHTVAYAFGPDVEDHVAYQVHRLGRTIDRYQLSCVRCRQ